MAKLAAILATLALLAPLSAAAQEMMEREPGALRGRWTGLISEPGALIPAYTLSVHIGLDASGEPVGVAHYDAFPCTGAWSNSAFRGDRWTMEQSIVDGAGSRCAEQVMVELVPNGDAMDVRLTPFMTDVPPATGRLERHH